MSADQVLEVEEAIVIHHGDTLVVRVQEGARPEPVRVLREELLKMVGHLVEDVVVLSADGLYVIRRAA